MSYPTCRNCNSITVMNGVCMECGDVNDDELDIKVGEIKIVEINGSTTTVIDYDDMVKTLCCMRALENNFKDIENIYVENMPIDFKIVKKVDIFKATNSKLKIEDYVDQTLINSSNYIAIQNDVNTSILKYSSVEKLANYIAYTEGSTLSAIFINKQSFDFKITRYFKVEDYPNSGNYSYINIKDVVPF